MLMADVLTVTFLILGAIISLQGLWLLCRALWPNAVMRSRSVCHHRPRAAFFIGLLVVALCILPIILISKLGAPGRAAAFTLFSAGFLFASCGVSGLATHIGQRLLSPVDADRPWKATLRGGIVLAIVYPLPIIGWFGIIPASLILGAGAMTLGWFTRERTPAVATAAPVAPASITATQNV